MARRATVTAEVMAEVLVRSRRRCCICFALASDDAEKKGQVAHLDRDATNGSLENLVFLCFDHHDQYDSSTSQSKGLTVHEVQRYRDQLARHLAQRLPLSDSDVARALLASLDRPAFRTPFRQESSLPRFRAAIAEAVAAINTGKTPSGAQLTSKAEVRDASVRAALDAVVGRLVALRAAFDELLRSGDIRPCGCGDPDCPTFMLSDNAAQLLDRRRHELLVEVQGVDPSFSATFYGTA